MREPTGSEEPQKQEEVGHDGVVDWAVPSWKKAQGKRRREDARHDAEMENKKNGEEEEVADDERIEPPRTEEGIMDEVLSGEVESTSPPEAKPSRKSRKEKRPPEAPPERRRVREYPEAGEFLDFSPEEAAERWKEELERREREATEAAARGATRVFEAGGTPEEVYEAQVAGEDFRTKMRGAAKRALARAANAFSGFGAKFKGMFTEEDWSLPDEVVVERRRQIDEKWERAKKEGRTPDVWNKEDSSTSTAEGGASPDKQEAAQTSRKPSENVLFQLRENLDVQRRTLARITDNPEEAAKVQAKIDELKEAIKKETGKEELSPEEAREKATTLRARIAALEARHKTAGKGVADHRARSYLDQLEENLDVQRRTLARITDNPEEAAKVQAKIDELKASIAKENGAALSEEEPATQEAIEREILALEKELYRCEGIISGFDVDKPKETQQESTPQNSEAAASSSPQTERVTHPAASEEAIRATVQKSFEALKRVPKDLELKYAQAEDVARQSVIDYVDANAAEAGRLVAEKREALKAQGVSGAELNKQLWEYVNSEVRDKIESPTYEFLRTKPVKRIARRTNAEVKFYKKHRESVNREIPFPHNTDGGGEKNAAPKSQVPPLKTSNSEAPPSIVSEKEAWKSLKGLMKEYDKKIYSTLGEKAVNAAVDVYVDALTKKIEDMVMQRRIKVAGKPKHIQLMQEFIDEKINKQLIAPALEELDKLGLTGTNRFPALERLKKKLEELNKQNA